MRTPATMMLPAAARLVLAALVLMTGLGTAFAQSQSPLRGPRSVADLARELTPSVVNISTTRRIPGGAGFPFPETPEGSPLRDLFDRLQPEEGLPEREVASLGSGFVIDESGLIATNNHVIADAEEIVVLFPDGQQVEASLVGSDDKTDLAVLRIDTDRELVPVRLGDSEITEIGDWVMAIGNPFGLGGSVSLGIVSARNRDINSGPYDNFIQTDAAINQGNSGGPLFDMHGDVVGINTAIIATGGQSLGVGFAIPINLARPVLFQLAEYGETRRGWLGVGIQDVTSDIAESLGLTSTEGALVLSVTGNGPSDGLIEQGDIITTFDGKRVERMRDLPRIVAETEIGKQVDVEVLRDGDTVTVNVTLGRLEQEEARVAENRQDEPDAPEPVPPLTGDILGMILSEMTDALRDTHTIDTEVHGVVVTEIDRNADAFDKGLRTGMVIAQVDQQPVNSPEDVANIVDTAQANGKGAVLMMVQDPRGNSRFLAIRIE
ncbi:Do family serine endopeptidase [Cucumibacter marinus]|uniref:Do family serine endopeptidase n=1 Tax=Cucumibacter marinus TaxID=1121252 RepID=UPI000403B7FD|nr:Do family serine endopeptidase [Cucumibacter marinus]